MKGFFSVPGVFFFLVLAILYISLIGAFVPIINAVLPAADFFTQLVVSLILPIIPIALLIGFYRSIINPVGSYGNFE
jgi:hypothetical protein